MALYCAALALVVSFLSPFTFYLSPVQQAGYICSVCYGAVSLSLHNIYEFNFFSLLFCLFNERLLKLHARAGACGVLFVARAFFLRCTLSHEYLWLSQLSICVRMFPSCQPRCFSLYSFISLPLSLSLCPVGARESFDSSWSSLCNASVAIVCDALASCEGVSRTCIVLAQPLIVAVSLLLLPRSIIRSPDVL